MTIVSRPDRERFLQVFGKLQAQLFHVSQLVLCKTLQPFLYKLSDQKVRYFSCLDNIVKYKE